MSEVIEGPWLRRPPQSLFHYVSLRTEAHLDRLERLLLRDELYVRSLVDLNPVFDRRTMEFNPWYVEPGWSPSGMPGPERSGPPRDASPGATGDRLETLGIVCLSEHQDSASVWRNHGDRQRGACLRVATTAAFVDRTRLLPVHYGPHDAFPAMPAGRDRGGLAEAIPGVLTKPAGWEDEAEWRWLLPGRAATQMEIDPTLIDGVVLGPLMPAGLRERILKLVSQRCAPTAVYQTRTDPDTMRVIVAPVA